MTPTSHSGGHFAALRGAAAIAAPTLTLPDEEAAYLRAAYDTAGVILEYGCGGSTVMASETAGTKVWAVESDKAFLDGLQGYFDANPPKAEVNLHHADIGPTGKWGRPKNEKKWRDWPAYPLGVWALDGFAQPDVVLIDGRFRAACFLAVAFQTTTPVTVYWDDYAERERYHEAERLAKPVEMVGRMARFELTPMQPKGADLAWILDVFGRIQ